MKKNLVGKILGKIKIFVQDFVTIVTGISDRILGIKGSAEHSRWTCVDIPSCSVDKKIT